MKNLSASTIFFGGAKPDWKMIKDAGFDFAEARCEDILPDDDPAVIDSIKDSLRKNSLKLSSVHSFWRSVDISSADRWTRVKSLREVEKAVITASRLSCNFVIAHLSGKLQENADREMLLKNAFASFDEAKRFAKEFNVEILAENLPKGYLLSAEAEIEEAFSRGINLCFDIGHARESGIDPLSFCKKHSGRIKAAHMHFNDGKSDSHNAFRDGLDDELFKNTTSLLDDNAFVILEMKPEIPLSEIRERAESLIAGGKAE